MASIADVKMEITVSDATGVTAHHKSSKKFSPASALVAGKLETVTLTQSAFTALSPPTGARAVALMIPTTAISLTLKGITGDTGVKIAPTSNCVGIDALIPLGTSPSIGIANGDTSDLVIQVLWM